MVQVLRGNRGGNGTATGSGPVVHVHAIERHIHGNGIYVKVWGELKIAAKEYVYARELKLNTIQVLLLTPKTGDHHQYSVQKYVHNEGEYDNYASIDIWSATGYEMIASGRSGSISAATTLPADGSLWLDFMALGE